MKRVLYILFCLVVYIDVQAQTALDAVLQGTVINAKNNFIELKYLNNPLDDSLSSVKIDLNEKGQFYFELPIRRPLDAFIYLNNQYAPIYIEPSERIEISVLADDVFRSISFISENYNNQFLLEFKKKYERPRNTNDRNKHIINDNSIAYAKYEDDLASDKLLFLDEYKKENNLSELFVKRQTAAIKFGAANYKYTLKENCKKLANVEKDIPDVYYFFVDTFSVYDNSLITVPEFYEFLEHKFKYTFTKLPYKANNEFETVSYMYNTAHSLYNDRIQNIFLTKKFAEILDTYSYEYTSRFISNYMSTVYQTEYRAIIDKKIEKAKQRN